VNLYSAFL